MQLENDQPSLNDKISPGLPTTASTLITEMYHQDKGVGESIAGNSRASSRFCRTDDRTRSTPSHEDAPYAPFRYAKDAFAKWIAKYKPTKGAADAFPRNSDLEAMREGLSFRNADEWLAQ